MWMVRSSKDKIKTKPSPYNAVSQAQLHSPFLTPLLPTTTVVQADHGQYALVRLCLTLFSHLFSSHFSPILFLCSSMGLSLGLRSLKNCSSVSPLHRLESFRKKICSCVHPPRATVPVRRTCSHVNSSIPICSIQHRALHRLPCGYLPHCGLFHELQGNTYSWCLEHLLLPSSTTLVLTLLFLTLFSLTSHIAMQCFTLKHTFTEVPLALLMGSIVSCGGSIVEPTGISCVWNRVVPELFSQQQHLQPSDASTLTLTPNTFTNISDARAAKSVLAGWLILFAAHTYENIGMCRKVTKEEFARG